tara:strand:- start:34 stop:564 length:531 start_codon:yes stop_codon:yes gene_type:complete
MKFVKNIAIVVCASSFMFAGIGFHMANNYGTLEDGATVTSSWGVTYDLNDNTSVGWDANLGMLMMFDVPMGVSLRLGWTATAADACSSGGHDNQVDCDADDGDDNVEGNDDDPTWGGGNAASTSIGLGYTWWSGGEGLNTTISTNYDYIMAPNAADFAAGGDTNYSNLSVTVGFGF